MPSVSVDPIPAPTSVAMLTEKSFNAHPEAETPSRMPSVSVDPIQAPTGVAMSMEKSYVHPEAENAIGLVDPIQAPTVVAMSTEKSFNAHPEAEVALVVGATKKRKQVEHPNPLALAREKRGEHTSWVFKSPFSQQPPTTPGKQTKPKKPPQKKKNRHLLRRKKRTYMAYIRHINIFIQLTLKHGYRSQRWTTVDSSFEMLLPINGVYSMADGTVVPFKPWLEVDRVFIPLNVCGKHWALGVLDLQTFTITIYDSDDKQIYKPPFLELVNDMVLLLLRFLDHISYSSKGKFVRPQSLNINVEYPIKVPAQAPPLGDCGVFVCMNKASLRKGEELDLRGGCFVYSHGISRYDG